MQSEVFEALNFEIPSGALDTFDVENILTSVNVTGEATMNTLMGFDRHFFMPINVHCKIFIIAHWKWSFTI